MTGSRTIAPEQLMTIEEFMLRDQSADGSSQELVDGIIITMPPADAIHGIICTRVASRLLQFVESRKLGWVACNDAGTMLKQSPDNVRGPDVAFYAKNRVPVVPQGYFEVAPDIVVEVVSPSDSAYYIQKKVVQYLEAGVRLIWVIYPLTRDVLVYHSLDRGQHLTEQQSLDGGSVLPGFSCRIAEIFDEIRS